MMHQSRTLEERIKALEFSQREVEFLCSQNASLDQKLKDSTSMTLGYVVESFENVMQQVEYFHRLLVVTREEICLGQVVQYGRIVSILE